MRTPSLSVLALLCTGFVALVGYKSQTAAPNPKAKPSLNLVGEYFQGGGYGGPSIKLLADGQYEFEVTSDTEATKKSGGDYTITDGLLVLSPRYRVNSTTDMRYLPVKWGKRLYLLVHDQDELPFCNAINLGEEPVPISRPYLHIFMMGTNDEKNPSQANLNCPRRGILICCLVPSRGKSSAFRTALRITLPPLMWGAPTTFASE